MNSNLIARFIRTALWATLVALISIGAIVAKAQPPIKPKRPTKPTLPVPEFSKLAQVLQDNQQIVLGQPITGDIRYGSLKHLQLFANGPFVSSVEMHADGTIYVAFVPPKSPIWYDVSMANDNDKTSVINAAVPGKTLPDFESGNVDTANWQDSTQAFTQGRGPAPHWFVVTPPVMDPCSQQRSRLAALQHQLSDLQRSSPPAEVCLKNPSTCSRYQKSIDNVQAQIDSVQKQLATPACQPATSKDWATFFANASSDQTHQIVARDTPPLPNSGDYCSRKYIHHDENPPPYDSGILDVSVEEWQTILPVNIHANGSQADNGQRMYNGQPLTWDELTQLMQTDSNSALTLLTWQGKPTLSPENVAVDQSVPWVTSNLSGIVTNSFLSGADWPGDHTDAPLNYWLGDPLPFGKPNSCTLTAAVDSRCDDWVVYVLPDFEYHFTRAQDPEHEARTRKGLGNFGELKGNLENETEQWMAPGGFRPEPGDRIWMAGRWVIDCGHMDWHGEIHPYEAYTSSHTEPIPSGSESVQSTFTSVVVTADWQGGTTEVDLWPPARPDSGGTLAWQRDPNVGISFGLTISEQPAPQENPNHMHLTISGPYQPLQTGGWNDIQNPNTSRRYAAKYHLWWTPAALSVSLAIIPANDSGTFNVLIDGAAHAPVVENGGSVGPLAMTVGNHGISLQGATGTDLTKYTVAIGGDCSSSGVVTLAAGDRKTCTIRATRKNPPNCAQDCEQTYQDCAKRGDSEPGSPTPAECGAARQSCLQACNQ